MYDSRPHFLIEAENKVFRMWPVVINALFHVWGRALKMQFDEQQIPMENIQNEEKRDDVMFETTPNFHESNLYIVKQSLMQHQMHAMQDSVMQVVHPFFVKHPAHMVSAILNIWESSMNDAKMDVFDHLSKNKHKNTLADCRNNDDCLKLNFGGYLVFSHCCDQHLSILHLLMHMEDDIRPER